MMVFCVLVGSAADICVFFLSAECPSSLFKFSVAAKQITLKLSSLKQCTLMTSQFLGVRNVSVA